MIALADKYYLIAPDYPGFGFSDFPDIGAFEYSFENISAYIDSFTEAINLQSFTICLHDYGCPVGLRIDETINSHEWLSDVRVVSLLVALDG